MHDLEAEAQQILSDFQRRKKTKRLEGRSQKTVEVFNGENIETLEAELSKKHGFPVKLTKAQAIMYEALMEPKPTDKGGRGIRRKPLPNYISRKRLQQCRFILRRSEKLAEDVMADAKSIDEALLKIRHNRTPEIVAIHEAGHAVIAGILGLVCGGASIVGDNQGTAGISYSDWIDDENRKRPKRHGRDADVMVSMAGSEAEVEILGKCCGGDLSDRTKVIEQLSGDSNPCRTDARLRRMTRMLCKRHRASIELIAKALVEANNMSGRQIDELLLAC
jgi:hypothetical protein